MFTIKEWTVAAACAVVLMFAAESYSQEASANATQGQSQGQSQVGGIAGASSDQTQSQGQWNGGAGGSGGSVSNSGNVRFNNSFNGSDPIRFLPVPTAVPLDNLSPSIFGRADYGDKGPDFVSARQWIKLLNLTSLNDVEVEGRRSIRIISQMMNKPKKQTKQASKARVKFEINDGEAINAGLIPVAMMTVQTEKPDKSNSASLAIAIGKEAKTLGCNTVVFMTEGSSKTLSSWGVGIGLSYNSATVDSKPSGSGSVGSGGTGWSMGKAGYKDLIYLSAVCGTRKAN